MKPSPLLRDETVNTTNSADPDIGTILQGFKLTIISTMLKDFVEKVDNWNELMHEEFWQKDGNHKEIENTCICPEGERVPQPEEGN